MDFDNAFVNIYIHKMDMCQLQGFENTLEMRKSRIVSVWFLANSMNTTTFVCTFLYYRCRFDPISPESIPNGNETYVSAIKQN